MIISSNIVSTIITDSSVFFFDLDGTLVNTNYANWLAYKKALFEISPNLIMPVYHEKLRFNRAMLCLSFPDLDAGMYEKIILAKTLYYKEFLEQTHLNGELVALLRQVSSEYRTYLLTNCRKERAFMVLDFWDLISEFDDIICNETGRASSDLNKYKTALMRLHVSPEKVIAFEDEEAEISKAKMSNIKTINPKLNLHEYV